MASSILFIVVLFFSVRGFFLGFTGVIARLLGFVLGYFIAFSYRGPLASFIIAQTATDVPPMLLQVATSAGLFFTTLFVTGLLVTGFFTLITKLVPVSKELFDSKSPGSQVFGAGCNGLIGASLVLIALWGYALVMGNPEQPDTLQRIANRFGDSVLALASNIAGSDSATTTQSTTGPNFDNAENTDKPDNKHTFGIEAMRQLIRQTGAGETPAIDIKQLLENDNIQQLLNDPAIKNMALEQLQSNPEQVMNALNDPKIRQMLEQQQAQ